MWLWISVAVVAVLLLALVAWKVLSSSKLSNRPRRSTILGPPPQSSRTQLKSPPRYGSASIMPNRPLGNMVNPSQNQNQYPTNYSPQPSPITSSEIDNPSQDLFEHGLYDEFPYVTDTNSEIVIFSFPQLTMDLRCFDTLVGNYGRLF